MEAQNGYIYLASYNVQTNKIFKRYFEACDTFIPTILSSLELHKQNIQSNFRRFKHNLITHHTNIHQELEAAFPITNSNTHGALDQIDFIIKKIEKNPQKSAVSILKVIKSSNLMKAEFDVYDMLSSNNPSIEFYNHSPHKLILLVISPFWLEFVEKGIKINIKECKQFVYVDYKSISVVINNILENASKYILPNSNLYITFDNSNKYIDINFEMVSLKIEQSELYSIQEEGISGTLAKKLNLAGNGIGLGISNKLLQLNKGQLIIKINTDTQKNVNNKGIPFEKNIFTIRLPKSFA